MPHTRARASEERTGSPRVIALGWDQPSMRCAAAWLAEAYPATGGVWDLGRVTVVTQGGRAGRILEAMQLERAEADRVGLIPPLRVGPGEIADLVVDRAGRPAPPVVRRMAWIRALRDIPATELAPLIRVKPESDGHAGAIAAMLEHDHAELAGEMVLFADVPARAAQSGLFDETDRWVGAAAVQDRYLALLAQDGWVDADADRVRAVREGRVRVHSAPIVLVGVVDLPGVARAALEAATDVVCLVFAPQDRVGHFDAWGRPSAWWANGAPTVLTHDMVRFADNPSDQAAAAIEALGEITASPAPEDVVIGVPDATVVPALRRWLAEVGAWGRPAAGTPAARTRPVRAVMAVADALEDPSWAPLATVVRHPDVVRWIDAAPGVPRGRSWLAALDDHAASRVPRIALGSADDVEGEQGETIRAVLDAVRMVIGDLASDAARPLSAWMDSLDAMVSRVYPDGDDSGEAADALAALGAAMDDARVLAGTQIDVPMAAARALRVIAEFAGHGATPEAQRDNAVDLVGWLELASDPASIVIVTGMNEGSVPSSVPHDAMVPDGLRRALGLADDARRMARDSYLLELIARQGRRARFIAGRRTADGDPVVPSRLLLRASPDELPAWVARFTDGGRDAARPGPVRGHVRCGPVDCSPVRPVVDPDFEVRSMSVTAFKDYIESPYLFYLRHVLRLKDTTDGEPELSPGGFGSLVHETMRAFKGHARARDEDPERVERALMECLDEAARVILGDAPALAVRVQLEMARGRIRRLAPAQAARTAEGWVIEEVEWSAPVEGNPGAPVVMVDGEPMGLRGKIDRIERHAETGEFAIVDFKTGESATDPDRSHRAPRGDREWKDLQLPLYAVLARSVVGDAIPRLGYCVLSSDAPDEAFRFAEWQREDLDSAMAAAAEVVRGIRRHAVRRAGRASPWDPVVAALVRVDRDGGADEAGVADDAGGGA